MFIHVPCQDDLFYLKHPVQRSCNSKTMDRISRPNN